MADLLAGATPVRVNDSVYDLALGRGTVTSVNIAAPQPISVKFDYKSIALAYTTAGELYGGSGYQTLYQNVPTVILGAVAPVDWANIAEGAAIQVSSDGGTTYVTAYFVSYHPTFAKKYLASLTTPISAASAATFYTDAKL